MFAVMSTLIIIWLVMWGFYKFMYPKPPKHYYPQAGDVLTLRRCDYCGHELAQYRGIVDSKKADTPARADHTIVAVSDAETEQIGTASRLDARSEHVSEHVAGEWFFCNQEHQQAFYQQGASSDESKS